VNYKHPLNRKPQENQVFRKLQENQVNRKLQEIQANCGLPACFLCGCSGNISN